MATVVLIVLLAWVLTALAVLGLARLLGRLSTSPSAVDPAPQPVAARPASDNVVALLARPRNDLVRSGDETRRAA